MLNRNESEIRGQLQALNLEINRVKSSLLVNAGRTMAGEKIDDLPKAAVSMILRPDPSRNDLVTLLVKRKVREDDPWSGHMAFPGGRYSQNDKHLLATVIREVLEETSVDLRNCSIIGTLDEVVPGNVSIKVTPYVALAPETLAVKIDSDEIEDFLWVPMSFFRDSKNTVPYKIERFGMRMEVPSYQFLGRYVVWGMTLKIIQNFIAKVYGSGVQ